jgi:D-alanyl-D-alanine carboxypeptidase/D-alanyl-D-alanine-endopeptidase (penicillin-binding protein 4)
MCWIRQLVCFVALGLGLSIVHTNAEAEDWRDRLRAVMDEPTYEPSHWGILVTDLSTGESLFEHNPKKLFVPASTTKLYSVAAAMEELGADFRFETPIYRRGEVDADGQLDGDLILVASGDLTMGGRIDADGRIEFTSSDHTYANGGTSAKLTAANPLAGIQELARQVAAAGIKSVRGNVLIDDRLFERASSTGSGPETVSPLCINDNVVDVIITPAAEAGHSATFEWRPQSTLFQVDCQVDTAAQETETDISIHWGSAGRIVVRGKIPAGHAPVVRIADWSDPEFVARGFLIEALQRAGIKVHASLFEAPAVTELPAKDWYGTAPTVAKLVSPPFSENAKLILKVSHNLHASTLPLLIAAKRGERTLAAGLKHEGEFLTRANVDINTISFGGGAGGSRSDYVTPEATVQLLRFMSTRPQFSEYLEALPILGVDGTLSTVVDADSPAKGKVRAKTGTYYLDNGLNGKWILTSKALAGYVDAQSGRKIVFAAFVNGTHLDNADQTKREGRTLGRVAEIIQQGL